jgi:hypothetical protein
MRVLRRVMTLLALTAGSAPRPLVLVSATAVAALRRRPIMSLDAGRWIFGELEQNAGPLVPAAIKALRDNLEPFAHGVYVNQLGETSEELVRAAYGVNYARLVAIKKKYPTNVLQLTQNTRPG